MTFTNAQKQTLDTILANSNNLDDANRKFVVQTNIFKCYQNGHQWYNNFHSFWATTKDDALVIAQILNEMGVHTKVKTHLGYDVK